jgi:non-specific serine/threonine protein kinase
VLDLGSPRGRAQATTDAGPVLDEHAKAQYKQRLQDLAEEIEEAEAWGDPVRGARARREADLLTEQLVRAVGLGGRDRRVASDAERARVSVTKALRTAVKRIADQEAELGAHLGVSVRTGSFCAYCPDPASAVVWTL